MSYKRADFTWYEGVSICELIIICQFDYGRNYKRYRAIGIMKYSILRNFTDSVVFGVWIIMDLLEIYHISLVFSHFVVRLQKLVLNSNFLNVKVRVNADIFYLKFEWQTSFDQVSRIKDFYVICFWLHLHQISSL